MILHGNILNLLYFYRQRRSFHLCLVIFLTSMSCRTLISMVFVSLWGSWKGVLASLEKSRLPPIGELGFKNSESFGTRSRPTCRITYIKINYEAWQHSFGNLPVQNISLY